MPTDSIRTRVVTFNTAKHFIISIETLFKRYTFSVIRQHKLWNDAQLRIATELASVGTLLQTQLLSNVVLWFN